MNSRFVFVVLISVVFLASCASAPKVTDTHSGFLTDYSKLKASGSDSASYEAEGYDPKNYGKIVFAPVQVQLSNKLMSESNLDAKQQNSLSQYVAGELNNKLSAGFKGKGTGTLKIRAAVSGIARTTEELSAWQYIPVSLVVTGAMEASGARDKALVLFFEAEATDEATGKIVAAKVRAASLGQADNADFEKDPVGAMKPVLDKWIDQLVKDINKQLQ